MADSNNNFIFPYANFPQALSSLYDPATLGLTYPQLLQKCLAVADSIQITKEQVRLVEEATRDQAVNRLWFAQRAGRITASIFKNAARTNSAMPSPSLIKRVCYPEAFCFSTEATRWGSDKEKEAREAYILQEAANHRNLVAEDCGLTISTKYPFIGASPDGVLRCACCKPRLLEIKCPACIKEELPTSGKLPKSLCLEQYRKKWRLKRDHQYFYQVQMQMNVCNVSRCVFVVWTKRNIICEEIKRNRSFFKENLKVVRHFFITGVLPELVGKWLSRRPVQPLGYVQLFEPMSMHHTEDEEEEYDEDDDQETLWCFCESPSFGAMIACNNKTCTIQWFHMECLLLEEVPKGNWYCPHCRKLPRNSAKKNIFPAKDTHFKCKK